MGDTLIAPASPLLGAAVRPWLHLGTGIGVALGCYALLGLLLYALRKQSLVPRTVAAGVAVFVALCGSLPLFEILDLWAPAHWAVDAVQLAAGVLGVTTALVCVPLVPRLLRLPALGADPLTGLPNRTQFTERLRGAIARARRDDSQFAILFVDLDGFKEINDRHGHAAGDALLVAVGRRLRSKLRTGDCVARFGGDEFVVLVEAVAGEHAAFAAAHRIVKSLAQPYDVEGREVRVGASVGLALGDGNGDAAKVIGEADHAMYRAKSKRAGRQPALGATA